MVLANSSAGSVYSVANTALGWITPANVTNPVEFWLAFMLIAVIINTVLMSDKIEFFKEGKNKGSRVIISIVISFFAVTVVWVDPVLVYISSTLAITVVILVAIIIAASITGLDVSKNKLGMYLFIAALLILFLGGGLFSHLFLPVPGSTGSPGSTSGVDTSGISSFLASSDVWYAIAILVFIMVVAWALLGPGGNGPSGPSK